MLHQSGIEVFSVSETIGFKDHQATNLLDNWFSSGSEYFDSIFLFSFTQEEKAEHALELVGLADRMKPTGFPIRGFIIPVDKASYTTT